MKRAPLVILALVVGLLVAGFWGVFRDRMGAGDIYPLYSSERADPLGTRALYDSLGALPGFTVTRSVDGPQSFPVGSADTHLYIGMHSADLAEITPEECLALDQAAKTGARIVFAMAYESVQFKSWNSANSKKADDKKTGDKKVDDKSKDPEKKEVPVPLGVSRDRAPGRHANELTIQKLWGFTTETSTKFVAPYAYGGSHAPSGLPSTFDCVTALTFMPDENAGWSVVYQKGGKPVTLERPYGRGSIVLIADPYFLTNEALQLHRSTKLLAWVVGPNHRVIFQEDIHGGAEEPGIMAMIRKFGFTDAVVSFLILALVYVWREVSTFVPPAEHASETILAVKPTAGLSALLRRTLSPAKLYYDCVDKWKEHASSADRARIDALAEAPHPATSYNQALSALKRR